MTEADWLAGADPEPLLRFAAPQMTDRQRLLFMAGCCRRIWDLLTDHRYRPLVELAEAVADGRATAAELDAAAGAIPPPGPRVPSAEDPLIRDELLLRRTRTFSIRMALPAVPVTPPGVLNFQDLPVWCQQAYYAIANVQPRNVDAVATYCVNAAGSHAAEQATERHPYHEEIRRLRDDVRRGDRAADDYRWRGAEQAFAAANAAARTLEREVEQRVRELTEQIGSDAEIVRLRRSVEEKAAQAALVRCVVGSPFRSVAADPGWLTSTVRALVRGIVADHAFDRLPILADALQDAGCDSDDVLSHCRDEPAHAKGCWVVELLSQGGSSPALRARDSLRT